MNALELHKYEKEKARAIARFGPISDSKVWMPHLMDACGGYPDVDDEEA